MDSFTVLKPSNLKSKGWQDHVLTGRGSFLPLQASGCSRHPLTCGTATSISTTIFTGTCPLWACLLVFCLFQTSFCLFLIRTLSLDLEPSQKIEHNDHLISRALT